MIILEAVNKASDPIDDSVHLVFRFLAVCCYHDWSTLLKCKCTLQLASSGQCQSGSSMGIGGRFKTLVALSTETPVTEG